MRRLLRFLDRHAMWVFAIGLAAISLAREVLGADSPGTAVLAAPLLAVILVIKVVHGFDVGEAKETGVDEEEGTTKRWTPFLLGGVTLAMGIATRDLGVALVAVGATAMSALRAEAPRRSAADRQA